MQCSRNNSASQADYSKPNKGPSMIGSPGPAVGPGAGPGTVGNGGPFKPVPPPKPKNYRPPIGGGVGSNGSAMHHPGQWDNGVRVCATWSLVLFAAHLLPSVSRRNRFRRDHRTGSTIHRCHRPITITRAAWHTTFPARRTSHRCIRCMGARTVERTEPPVATVVVLVVQRCTTATTPTVVIPIWAMVVSGTWQWVPVTVITPTVTHNTPTAILTCKEVTVLELMA